MAERKNCHLFNIVWAFVFKAHTPISYCGEALLSATYLINRVPSRIINFQTPYQLLSTLINAPSTINLPPRVFGCVAYVHLHKHQRSKLEPRAARCVFVGYGPHQKGYRCYHPATRHMFTTMDVQFHESTMYFSTYEFQGESSSHTEIHNLAYKDIALPDKVHHDKDNDNMALESPPGTGEEPLPGELTEAPDNIQSETIHDHMEGQVLTESSVSPYSDDRSSNVPSSDVPSQSTPAPDLPEIGKLPPRANRGIPKPTYEPDPKCKVRYPLSNYVSTKRLSESNKSFVCQLSSVSIPNSVQEAKTNPKWQEAMDEELRSLKANNTWRIVDLPAGKKPVGCKWVYTIKYLANGSIDRYKARLVAKGYTQKYGIDYTDTFAPVAKINTVRILLSLAANLEWPLHQLDVKNAFLHGALDEEVYMSLPPGYQVPDTGKTKVCRLQKSLYGLKQSPRAWFGRLTQAMIKFGYKQSNVDHTLFIKRKGGKLTVLVIYVDDMIITRNDESERVALQRYLSMEFEMKDLGTLKYFLGIEVSKSKECIFLC